MVCSKACGSVMEKVESMAVRYKRGWVPHLRSETHLQVECRHQGGSESGFGESAQPMESSKAVTSWHQAKQVPPWTAGFGQCLANNIYEGRPHTLESSKST